MLAKCPKIIDFSLLTILPTMGGGGLFGQTGSQNSRTLSPRISKISDFVFMFFGHIVAKFRVDLSARGVAVVIFQTRGHEK